MRLINSKYRYDGATSASIFSVTLVVLYGQTRILFAIGRDGLLPERFAKVSPRTHTPVFNTIVVATIVGLLAGFIRCRACGTWCRSAPRRVHRRRAGRHRPACTRARPRARFQSARLSGHPDPLDCRVHLHPDRTALDDLRVVPRLVGGRADVLLPVESSPLTPESPLTRRLVAGAGTLAGDPPGVRRLTSRRRRRSPEVTVVVGYGPAAGPGALELASTYADARGEDLLVVSVIPPRWSSPSLARQADAEFAAWAAQQGDAALARAKAELAEMGSGAEASFRRSTTGHRGRLCCRSPWRPERRESSSVRQRMHAAAASNSVRRELAAALVDGAGGHRTARLRAAGRRIHRCQLCRGRPRRRCGRDRDVEDHRRGAGVGLRLVTFAVRLDTMFLTVVGPGVEDEIVAAAREQSESYFGEPRAASVIDDGVQTVVGLGHGGARRWTRSPGTRGTCSSWAPHKTDVLTRVFLGTNATKIVRYAPVPVVVLPA